MAITTFLYPIGSTETYISYMYFKESMFSILGNVICSTGTPNIKLKPLFSKPLS